ncbi:DUF427 domain-containing protein [Parasphingorhabdus sp.]|uniref:DUF427 domain-containing protein n=1 Tax=Parasphingorhabdus sp. TaxID=2709688 RepID=UPI003D27973D
MKPRPEPPRPDQESVWDFPRPAVAQPSASRITIEHDGLIVADTRASIRTLETSHPPTYYIHLADINPDILHGTDGSSFCEWKGAAAYWDVRINDIILPKVGWSYPSPTADFAILRNHIAFYAAPFDRCLVDGETVIPQPGEFYGGWITSKLAGPFKGGPGSRGW